MVNQQWEEPLDQAKPFSVSKWLVWESWKRVKANKGACGIDEQSIQEFEMRLKDNLYKLWNRMSSGSYLPPPVRMVEIPKSDGRKRALGIPTVSDRIAQMVVKMTLEPLVEPKFHPSSYGYRPGKSAIEALGDARKRCWRNDWVLDLDIRGLFDNLDHELLMRAVRNHTDCKWVILYVGRWLKAPVQLEDGTLVNREKGTPQGGVISPLLANLFLHYAFDMWMRERYLTLAFERYADDILVHCKTERDAKALREAVEKRLREWKLELHPEKTRIVYCRDGARKASYPDEKFDFLGYTFRARLSKTRRGSYFVNFSPGVSNTAAKRMRLTMRRWQLQKWSDRTIGEIAERINPVLQGWINYYGRYYKRALYPTFQCLNFRLRKWVMRKYKRYDGHRRQAMKWLVAVGKRQPNLFAHWRFGILPVAGR